MIADLEIARLEARVGYVFAADNARTQRPFMEGVGPQLAKDLVAHAFVINLQNNQPAWGLRLGAVRFSETRSIPIVDLLGSPHELTVRVEGTTGDAHDVLAEAWSILDKTTPDGVLTDFPGSFMYETAATVKLPVRCTELLPPLEVMHAFAKDKLGEHWVRNPEVLPFRLVFPVRVAVHGAEIERNFMIEPRFTARTEDRTYFTTSPLKSDDHLAMLRAIIDQMNDRNASP